MLFLLPVVLFGLIGLFILPTNLSPQERDFTIRAHKYAYDPPVLRVNRGDIVRLRFASTDVVHGFYLEGYDLDLKITPLRNHVEARSPEQGRDLEELDEVVFTADRSGKFRYRCSETCGSLHPFMLGEFVVAPNRLLSAGLGAIVGLLLGGFLVAIRIGGGR